VSTQDQLTWEARWARPVAISAFLAGALLIANVVMFQSILKDRPGIRGLPDFLISVNDKPGLFVASSTVQAIGAALLVPVFIYLLRASVARGAGMPSWFVYLVIIGPVLYALSLIIGAVDRIGIADDFVSGMPIAGKAGETRAEDLVKDNPNVVSFALSFVGSIAVAFLFIMVPLRARRVGLLSSFMAILGVITGALLVLQLIPLVPVIVEAFWLGAIGALYLSRWPGGRGPAWETGEPDPWPTAAQRRGTEPMPERREEPTLEPGDATETEPEPVPQRPRSRKRKRKR